MTRALGTALVVLLVLATLGEGGARPTVLVWTHGLAAVLLVAALLRASERTLPWSKGPVALFLVFGALVAANAALSPYFYAALLVLLEIAAFVTVAFLAARFGPGFPAFAALGLLAAAVVQSSWVLWQWISGQPRPAGTFLNPSHLAAWLAAVLLLASGTRLAGWSARARIVLAVPAVAALFVAGSRGALLGLAAGIALLLREALVSRAGRKARLGAAAAAFLVLAAVAAGVSLRFREADPYRYDRLSIWRASLEMAAESPLLGTGPGQFQDAAANHMFPAGKGPLRFEKYFTGTHSDLLRLPAELGIPAAAALLLALAFAIRTLRRRGAADVPSGAMGARAALLCLGVQALVENLSERPAVCLLAAALLGSLLSAPPCGRRFSPRTRAAFAASIVALFLVGDVSPYLAWSSIRGLPRGALSAAGEEHLRRASRHNPLHPDFDLRTAEAIAADGRSWNIEGYARARDAAENAVRKSPRSAAYRVGLARVEALACGTLFRDQATRARARALYGDAARLARHDALIPLEEALFLLDAADLPGARRAAERALALEPGAVAPRLVLAEVALGSGVASGAGEARRLLDQAEELAKRSRPFATASRYARQLLTLDEAQVAEIRRQDPLGMSEGLLMLPVGDETVASVRFRVLAHLPALTRAGLTPRVRFPRVAASAVGRRLLRTFDLLGDAREARRARTVFVHRKTFPPTFATRLRATAAPIVFDVDDAIDLPPPSAASTPLEVARYARNFRATAMAADLVLCGNGEIAKRLPHGRFELLPTPIDTARFRPAAAAPATGPALGWVGHSDNFGYLASIAGPLREIVRRHPGAKLVVVADRAPVLPGLPVEFRRWSLESEIECFSGMSVGLMPLLDTPWARAKCAFKAIQYMALGIPTVASPVGMNRELVRDGRNGFLPEDDAAWVRALDALLADASLRARVAAEGRATVERDYSLEALSARLVSILRGVEAAPRSS